MHRKRAPRWDLGLVAIIKHAPRWNLGLVAIVAMLLLGSRARGGGGGGVSPPPPTPPPPPPGARFTIEALRAFARSKGFAQPDIAAAVAMAESGGNASALGDNGDSYGLWQIHVPSHPEYDRAQLFDPTYNAAAALLISAGGTNWQPWTTFRTGAYLPFLPQGAASS